MPTYTEQLQRIANEYKISGEPWPATTQQIAAWAIHNKKWAPQRATLIEKCASELGRAMGEEYSRDPQGRWVRAKVPARVKENGKQRWLWDDPRTATRDHMARSSATRRQQILGEAWQLKVDVDSFNENRSQERPIRMVWDFTNDLAERELAIRAQPSPTESAPPVGRFPSVSSERDLRLVSSPPLIPPAAPGPPQLR
jgi:hypothetical protein